MHVSHSHSHYPYKDNTRDINIGKKKGNHNRSSDDNTITFKIYKSFKRVTNTPTRTLSSIFGRYLAREKKKQLAKKNTYKDTYSFLVEENVTIFKKINLY